MMEDKKNMLKEVDMQIVYRRLEARKKNITNDGKMSKRQIAMAYRGYHGLESQYQALQYMSDESMMKAKHKNDHLKLKHVEDMKSLIENQKKANGHTDKDIQSMRDDFTTQLVYQYVYKNYSFKKYDKSREAKKPRPLTDKPEMYDKERKSVSLLNGQRLLGSLRQMETYKDELKLKLPAINKHDTTEHNKTHVNMLGDKTYDDLKQDATKECKASFPNIEGVMGVESKYRYNTKEDDKGSLYSAPAGAMDTQTEVRSLEGRANVNSFDMGQNLLLMRKMEQERYDRRRELPAPPPSRAESRNQSWRRILPTPPTRAHTVFPGNAKNDVQMTKILKKEVSEVVDTWSTHSNRLEQNERVKEMNKAVQMERPFPIIDRSRPTSAILKDFQEYKMYIEQQKAFREKQEHNQPIIIRQLSPQPRLDSPVAQRRSEYSTRISSPLTKGEDSPTAVKGSKLRRTESEKFPSVSRTSSYRNLPDGPVEIHENALLTAAERIEIEREKRKWTQEIENDLELAERHIHINATNDVNSKRKPRRRKLPTTPVPTRDRPKPRERDQLKHNEQMFDTSILKLDGDTDMINTVQRANKIEANNAAANRDKPPINRNFEVNPYQPISKQLSGNYGEHDLERQRYVNIISGKTLSSKHVKKMQFDYEHYSRTTPEMKKQLEMKAKSRRKIQLKNAKMAEERQKKDSSSVADSERPTTRVSFNENVIVFQTI